jgi:anti-anti-sigma factor
MPPASPNVEESYEPLSGPVFSCFRVPAAAGSARLTMVGELDLVTAESARGEIRRAQDETSALTCDLGDVWFVDLAGLRVLLDATAHAELTGGRLTLANCPPIVPRMLRLLKLDDAVDIQASPPSAAPRGFRRAGIRRSVS